MEKSLFSSVIDYFRKPASSDKVIRRTNLTEKEIKVENPRHAWGLYTNEFADLTPTYLKSVFEDARKGLNFKRSLLFEDVRRKDLRIGGVCQTRKFAVSKKAWEIKYDEDSSLGETERLANIRFIEDNFRRVKFTNFITDIVEAQIQGVSTFEINYEPIDGKVMLKSIDYIPNHILLYDDLTDMYMYIDPAKADLFLIRTLSANTIQDRIDVRQLSIDNISPLKILEVYALDGNAQNGFQNGCEDALIWAYFLKNYGLKDFSTYIERLGIPGIIGKYDPLMNDEEQAAFFDAVRSWGRNFKLAIPNTSDIQFMNDQNKGATGNLFLDYVNFWNDEISIRVLGQTLTTQVGSTGSFAAAKVHETVRNDIVVSDMLLVKEAVNEIIRRVLSLNNSNLKEFPELHWKEEIDVDYQKARSEIFMNIKNSGYIVKKENIESEFGVEVEEYVPPASPNSFFSIKKFSKDTGVSEKEINNFLTELFEESKPET
jgi:phage gp29-like protein